MHVLFMPPSSIGMTAPLLRGLARDRQLRAAARADMPRRGSVAQKEAHAAAGLTRARDSLWLTIPVRMIIAMLREVAGDYPLDAVAGAMMSQLIAAASQSAHITSRLSRNRPSLIVFR